MANLTPESYVIRDLRAELRDLRAEARAMRQQLAATQSALAALAVSGPGAPLHLVPA